MLLDRSVGVLSHFRSNSNTLGWSEVADSYQSTFKLPSAASPPRPRPPPASPSPSPPPHLSPSPAPSAVRETIFHIGYYQSKVTGLLEGAHVTHFLAAILANNSPGIGEQIGCQEQPTYGDEDYSTGERPNYRQKIPLASPGRNGCKFNRLGDNDADGLRCEGVLASCSKAPGDPEPVDCKDKQGKTIDSWRTQITCSSRGMGRILGRRFCSSLLTDGSEEELDCAGVVEKWSFFQVGWMMRSLRAEND